MIKPRPLTESEVTFTVELEPEDMPVRGNYLCTDEPELDKQAEDEIIERLDRGDISAWCCLKVTATWTAPDGTTLDGVDYLGGCSFSYPVDAYTPEVCAEEHGMKQQALDDLNETIAARYAQLEPLLTAEV